MASNYFVKLEQFEGPLDLLLHLIRVNELDIFDIDLFVLTSQYLEYLRLLKFKDLNDAALFMEMAANLIEIKSKQLLPNENASLNDEEIDEENEAASLQRRLLEYDRFKRATEYFEAMPQMGVQIQTNSEWKRLEPKYQHIEGPLKGEATTLVVLYEQMLNNLTERKPARVTAKTEKVSLEQVIKNMESFIRECKFALFQGLYPKMGARYDLVVNILSMLQLTRDGRLNIYQEELMGPIWLYEKKLRLEQVPYEGNDQVEPVEDLNEEVSKDNATDISDFIPTIPGNIETQLMESETMEPRE